MMNIRKVDCPENMLNTKCPYDMNPTRIVIHNTANDAAAENEIAYMHSNKNETSFHFAVDDKEAVQGIELNRNAWHAGDGNGRGNREGIAIEICYSKSGGEKWLKALENAAELTAKLLKDYCWGIDKVTKHQDYNGKHCPHRILDEYGWNNFLLLVDRFLNGDSGEVKEEAKAETKVEVKAAPQVIYAAHTVGGKWLPDVTGYNDVNADGYAGITGKAVDGIRARLTEGNIVYRVHTVGAKAYLPWVKNHDAAEGGYAGIFGKKIDGLQMKLEGVDGHSVQYRVATAGGNYLPWVTGCGDGADGYAGIYGRAIDRIQVRIV